MARASKTGNSLKVKKDSEEHYSEDQKTVEKPLLGGWTVEPAANRGFLVRRNNTPMRTFPTQELADKYVKRFSR